MIGNAQAEQPEKSPHAVRSHPNDARVRALLRRLGLQGNMVLRKVLPLSN